MKLGKYYIELFDTETCGKFWTKVSDVLKLDYFIVGFCWGFEIYNTFNDGYHHLVKCGIFMVNWGGYPYIYERNK